MLILTESGSYDATRFDAYRFDTNRFDPYHFKSNRFDPCRFDSNRLITICCLRLVCERVVNVNPECFLHTGRVLNRFLNVNLFSR
ncbi:hypothetical protein Hanom_Chr04g00348811 [Helianthus anomalus]